MVNQSYATVADDTALLGPWARAFEALCGAPVVIDTNDPAACRLTFPRVFHPIELIGSTGHFRERPAMAEQVRRLGFDWDADGRVMTTPAPGAFNARLATCGLPQAGFALAYAQGTAAAAPLASWLVRYLNGAITLLVYAPSYYESLLSAASDVPERLDARWGLLSLAHDLSVHALNYHLIPHSAVADLATRIRAFLPERYAAWTRPETITPLTLTYFYDNDLNRYTYAVWCACERPPDFAPIFLAKRNYDQLLAALDVRLHETHAGRGDIASGDFDEVGKLTQTSFDVA